MAVLNGKTAVITGGTRGLGLGIAEAFAAEGAEVVVASRSQKSVDEAVEKITGQGGRASGIAIDVASLEDMQALAEHALKTFGKIDIWVNNAGTAGPYGPTMAYNPEIFYRVIQTNIVGVYNGSRVALRYFQSRGSGKLINILGRGYNGPVPWQNAYAPSKAWMRSFTMALAEETRGSGVGVYAFNPGMVLTDLLTDVEVIDGSEDKLKNFPTVVRLLAKPPEFPARKAVWIASSATDGKTGLLVNGFSSRVILGGALREGLRRLLRRPAPPLDIRLKRISPD